MKEIIKTPTLDHISGTMTFYGTVTWDTQSGVYGKKGSFKTAHTGTLRLDQPAKEGLGSLYPHNVCVKQLYEKDAVKVPKEREKLRRLVPKRDYSLMRKEAESLLWAIALWDLTMKFISRSIRAGICLPPTHEVYTFTWVHAALAILQSDNPRIHGLSLLLEELLEMDDPEEDFKKYVGNATFTPEYKLATHPELNKMCLFLTFTQHVQWEETRQMAYISDYQGEWLVRLPAPNLEVD